MYNRQKNSIFFLPRYNGHFILDLTPSSVQNERKAIEGRKFRFGAIQVSSIKKGHVRKMHFFRATQVNISEYFYNLPNIYPFLIQFLTCKNILEYSTLTMKHDRVHACLPQKIPHVDVICCVCDLQQIVCTLGQFFSSLRPFYSLQNMFFLLPGHVVVSNQ